MRTLSGPVQNGHRNNEPHYYAPNTSIIHFNVPRFTTIGTLYSTYDHKHHVQYLRMLNAYYVLAYGSLIRAIRQPSGSFPGTYLRFITQQEDLGTL